MKVNEILQTIRISSKYHASKSIADICAEAGYHRKAFDKWPNGKSPKISTIIDIAETLGMQLVLVDIPEIEMTKEKFLVEYRALLKATASWAKDVPKLDKYMASVKTTITTDASTWIADGDVLKAVWKAFRMTGKPTLKALRELPSEVKE